MNDEDPDYTITAVDRALALLEAAAELPNASLTDLSRATGFTRSLVFRMAFTLEKRGYLMKSGDGRTYTLGYQPLYLSSHAHDQLPILHRARQFIDDLSVRTGQNANLIVRNGMSHLTILSKHPQDPNQLYARTGRLGPLYAGGGPKILLAFAPKKVQDAVLAGEMTQFTERTVTDPEQLRKVLEQIRKTGTNETVRDIDEEGFSFAAAVRGADGAVVAAVTVAGRIDTLNDESAVFFRQTVHVTAQRISETMGWRKWNQVG